MKRILWPAWAAMLILCAVLGTIQTAAGIVKIALSLISLACFVPGALLLYNGLAENDRRTVRIIRWICLASLLLTTVFLIVFILCAAVVTQPLLVNICYYILLFVSSPLFCGKQIWYIVLFLWACLFFSTFFKRTAR